MQSSECRRLSLATGTTLIPMSTERKQPLQKHLFLDCYVNDACCGETRVNALIDNACTTVLIKADFVDKLKLRRVPLQDKVMRLRRSPGI